MTMPIPPWVDRRITTGNILTVVMLLGGMAWQTISVISWGAEKLAAFDSRLGIEIEAQVHLSARVQQLEDGRVVEVQRLARLEQSADDIKELLRGISTKLDLLDGRKGPP